MKTTVTSVDVAQLARVSQSAVSRAFTPGGRVSESTRLKVLEAARKLGYRPNAHARSLITGRSQIIGVVLSHIENLFYPVALEALSRRLQQDGYHVLLFIHDGENAEELVRQVLQYHVDGIVLGSANLSSALAERCADARIPVVLFNRVMAPSTGPAVSSVRSDNLRGGRALADFLVQGGHRRVAYIAGAEESSTNLEREQGFREGLAAHGQRIYARAIGRYDAVQARLAALELFTRPDDRPDAVFVASDHMAIAVIDTLRHELGLSIPGDVSVVGFDNVPQAAWPAYALTTFEQPVQPMIEATVTLLQRSLTGTATPAREDVVVPGTLVVRQSARRPDTPGAHA